MDNCNVCDEPKPAIIVIGNLSDGFQFVGPFETWEYASAYDDEHLGHAVTWIATLEHIHPA